MRPRKPVSNPGALARGGRLGVRKTYKLYINGAFVRSESGRCLRGEPGADVIPRGSRKDVRDAVGAALSALPGWAGQSAQKRGQISYRFAEVLESRRAELRDSLLSGGTRDADRELDAAIDRAVSFAGWADKFQSLFSTHNPVASPHFAFSVSEPVGVVGLAAPARPSLLGLVGSLCPIVVAGNVVVAVVSETDPRTSLLLAECLATSDFPGGVVNLLSGLHSELLPVLARHKGVRALDLWDVRGELARALEENASDTCKRVARRTLSSADWFDARRGSSPELIRRFVETKSIWHPMGA